MGYHTAHSCATSDTNESLSPEIELRYEAIHQTKQSTVQQERNNNSWHPAAETNEFDPMRAESSTISIEARQMWSRRYCHRCDDQYLEVQRSSRARREDKRHDGPASNKAEHLHAANTSKRRIRGVYSLYAPPTTPRATQMETISAAPESGWTVTTIPLYVNSDG